ncbi:hypothetical protein BaRGS_00035838 [Batillaria attramentaria]|uniref:Uncharacterized protein n=1 Tax=Batillaria attramentaria TaxID=370345 RepID=A0ABD0JDF4_9CAEN
MKSLKCRGKTLDFEMKHGGETFDSEEKRNNSFTLSPRWLTLSAPDRPCDHKFLEQTRKKSRAHVGDKQTTQAESCAKTGVMMLAVTESCWHTNLLTNTKQTECAREMGGVPKRKALVPPIGLVGPSQAASSDLGGTLPSAPSSDFQDLVTPENNTTQSRQGVGSISETTGWQSPLACSITQHPVGLLSVEDLSSSRLLSFSPGWCLPN